MKIQFIKDHQDFKSGDVINIGATRAKRFINDEVAIDVDGAVLKDESEAEVTEVKAEKPKVQEKELKKEVETKELKTGGFLNKMFGKK